MNFGQFLRRLREKKNLPSAKALFEELGGRKTLKINLRRYLEYEAGKAVPRNEVIEAVWKITRTSEHHLLIAALIESHFGVSDISEYVSKFLLPQTDPINTKTVFSSQDFTVMDQRHFALLLQDEDAFRFYRKLHARSELLLEEVALPEALLKQMHELGLILFDRKKGLVSLPKKFVRMKPWSECTPRERSLQMEYYLKHMDTYLLHEGSPDQEVLFNVQTVLPAAAEELLGNFRNQRELIRRSAFTGKDPREAALVVFGFMRKIPLDEL